MQSDDIHIPPEAVEALRNRIGHGTGVWVPPSEVRAAIRAALENWPGMTTEPRMWRTAIILPLTEKTDD